MRSSYIILYVLISTIFISKIYAQRFGGNPPSMKWSQIETDRFKIIFPPKRVAEAERLANTITMVDSNRNGNLGDTHFKIPIVLQSLPTVSNGYVGLAPWRSEFYLNPLQNALDLGATSWIDNLAIHEYRHIHQYSNFRKGISKFMYLLAGQEGQSLANATAIPDWFFEGDAVYFETKYLNQGRGRLPYFFDAYHSLWNANTKYSYQKLRNGSYKDVVPDHYQLGYILVAHGNNRYGEDFWGRVTRDAVRFKGLIYPFQKAIKRNAGIGYRKFVSDAFSTFKAKLPSSANLNSETTLTSSNRQRVVDHLFPVYVNSDTVIALRKPFNQLPHWEMISAKTSKRLGLKFIGIDDFFQYRNHTIVYSAYSTDPRWDWKEFNDVYLFNTSSRTTTRITKRQRLFSPDISTDLSTIVAIEMPFQGGSVLNFWDVASKTLKQTVSHPNGYMLSHPVFGNDINEVFVVARKTDGSSSILKYSQSAHQFTELFPFKNAPIAFLRFKQGRLIFTVSQNSKNELWSYDIAKNNFNRMSSSNTGSYAGDVDLASNQVVYSRPTADGDQLFTGKINDLRLSPESIQPVQPVYPVSFLVQNQMQKVGDSAYGASSYSHLKDLVNIHSWRPYYDRPNWSFTLYGQNVLNTFQSSYQYLFNENEKSHQLGAYATYGAWYPWIVGGTNYTMNRNFRDSTKQLKWNEWNGNIGMRVPLSNNGGRFFRSLDFSSTLNNVLYNYDAVSKPTTKDKFVSYVHFQIVASMLSQQAKQQINPRFGWSLNLQHRTSVGTVKATQSYVGARVYLPGFLRTHSFNMSFAFQQRDTLRQYIYTNNFAMARGYAAFNYPSMWRTTFNYHLPLLYPDFGVAHIVYFRRLRANLFYDDMFLKSLRTGKIINLRSTGIELNVDTRWWNQQPVSFGVRYSRLLDTKKFTNPPNVNRWEIIMPVNLIRN